MRLADEDLMKGFNNPASAASFADLGFFWERKFIRNRFSQKNGDYNSIRATLVTTTFLDHHVFLPWWKGAPTSKKKNLYSYASSTRSVASWRKLSSLFAVCALLWLSKFAKRIHSPVLRTARDAHERGIVPKDICQVVLETLLPR